MSHIMNFYSTEDEVNPNRLINYREATNFLLLLCYRTLEASGIVVSVKATEKKHTGSFHRRGSCSTPI